MRQAPSITVMGSAHSLFGVCQCRQPCASRQPQRAGAPGGARAWGWLPGPCAGKHRRVAWLTAGDRHHPPGPAPGSSAC